MKINPHTCHDIRVTGECEHNCMECDANEAEEVEDDGGNNISNS